MKHLAIIAALLCIVLCVSPTLVHAQGACPSGFTITGNHCFYVAANGSDSNAGTSESVPWLHAPHMAGCTGIANSATQNGYNTILAIEWKSQSSGSAATCPITTTVGTSQWGAVCSAFKQ